MRLRSCLALSVAAGFTVSLLPVSPAQAITSATIVRTFTGPVGGAGIEPLKYHCTSFTAPPTGTAATITGPSTPPLGAGSLRLGVGPAAGQEIGIFRGNGSTGTPLSDLVALSFSAYRNTASVPAYSMPLYLELVIAPAGDLGGPIENLEYVVPSSATWQSIDATALTFDRYDTNGNPAAATTLSAYKSANPSARLSYWAIENLCDGAANSAVAVDNVVVDNTTSAGAVDFEPATTIAATGATTITAGGSRVLTATLKNGTTALSGVVLDIYAKAFGAASFTKIGTTSPTSSTGATSFVASPLKQTSYQFRLAASEPAHGAASSAIQSVLVKTRISKNIYDTTVTTTTLVQAYGTTYPAKPGTLVYLYKGATSIASSKVAADGSYLVQAKIATKGTYSVTVRGAAGSGNVAGLSPATSVTVS